MLVFDVCDEQALENLNQYWLPKVLENADENIELLMVGNKSDLINKRVIERKDIDKFIKSNSHILTNRRLSSSAGNRGSY